MTVETGDSSHGTSKRRSAEKPVIVGFIDSIGSGWEKSVTMAWEQAFRRRGEREDESNSRVDYLQRKEKTEEEEGKEGKAKRPCLGMRGKSYTKSWRNLMLSGNIDAFGGVMDYTSTK